MRLILTIFPDIWSLPKLVVSAESMKKNFSSPSRYYTLGDLALSSESTKLLMAVTDAVGRIEVHVLETSGNVLKQMWHGRTDCTSWEYRASSIIEFNGNYVVGITSDASNYLGAFAIEISNMTEIVC